MTVTAAVGMSYQGTKAAQAVRALHIRATQNLPFALRDAVVIIFEEDST